MSIILVEYYLCKRFFHVFFLDKKRIEWLHFCMPPLKNVKHEQFCRAIPNSKSVTKAYRDTYQCDGESAYSSATEVLRHPEVKNRLLEIFEEQGINDSYLSRNIKNLIDHSKKDSVKLGSIRTVLEVRKDIESAKNIGTQIVVNNEMRDKIVDRMKRYQNIIESEKQVKPSKNVAPR